MWVLTPFGITQSNAQPCFDFHALLPNRAHLLTHLNELNWDHFMINVKDVRHKETCKCSTEAFSSFLILQGHLNNEMSNL